MNSGDDRQDVVHVERRCSSPFMLSVFIELSSYIYRLTSRFMFSFFSNSIILQLSCMQRNIKPEDVTAQY